MIRAHSEVLELSLLRLRLSLFLAVSLPSAGDFQPEASQVPFAGISSLDVPYLLVVFPRRLDGLRAS